MSALVARAAEALVCRSMPSMRNAAVHQRAGWYPFACRRRPPQELARGVSLRGGAPGIHFEGTTASFATDMKFNVTNDEVGPLLRMSALGRNNYGFIIEVRLKSEKHTPLGLPTASSRVGPSTCLRLPTARPT